MKLEHIAIWTKQLEKLKYFYIKYFGASCNEKYISKNSIGFKSYFLSFEDKTRIELMFHPNLRGNKSYELKNFCGFAHIAFALKSKADVNLLIKKNEEQ